MAFVGRLLADKGIHTLIKAQRLLDEAQQFAGEIAHRGGTVLFVGTKKQARDAIKEVAEGAGMPFLPLIEVMRSWFGIPPDASRDLAEARLKEGLARLKLDQETTLHGCQGCTGDRILVNKLSYHFHDVNRGDVVVFEKDPTDTSPDATGSLSFSPAANAHGSTSSATRCT